MTRQPALVFHCHVPPLSLGEPHQYTVGGRKRWLTGEPAVYPRRSCFERVRSVRPSPGQGQVRERHPAERGDVANQSERTDTHRMRFVRLSDHPSDMLAEVRRERAAAGGKGGERYRQELAAYQAHIDQARDRRDQARNPLSGLRWIVAAWWRQLARPPRPPAAPA